MIVSNYPSYVVIKPDIAESFFSTRSEQDSILDIRALLIFVQVIFHIKASTLFGFHTWFC